ncbi:LysR family transcriptional regulator [Haliangium ochraceum]|uniref:Transcriptional regulator, LysR family n=1 Tax=Haliangium ochraceum (strain DSM 14365 / JCM 11303 / SMP-2) TaxID=502025 RepID=D0LNK9_HALO1|nr:LysR family transcriptional regulator [Haliangium ochraceum]ACY16914.1 transcriptional regulator, LysR family [Haliangium ochraceum DSM 14365]
MPKKTKQIRKNAKPETASLAAQELGWDELALILALTRERTLSGASRRLGINVSTVARRLDAAEARIAQHLFDRNAGGIYPTELAEALSPVAEQMEQAHAEAMRLVAGHESEPEGVVRITAPPGIANWLVAPLLVPLRARYPGLRIELVAEVSYADLTRRDADVALRISRPRSGDLVAVRLVEQDAFPVVAPSVAAERGRLRDPGDMEWVTWGADLAHMPDAQWLERHVPPTQVVLRTSSMDAQIHAARAGLGAMFLSPAFLPATGLVALPLAKRLVAAAPLPTAGALWMVSHRALRAVPRVAAVWSFFEEQARVWS